MNWKTFQQIRLHSEYSILDSTAYVDDLIERSYELWSKAIWITDFCAMWWLVKLTNGCNYRNLKQIYWTELLLTNILHIEDIDKDTDDCYDKIRELNKQINKLNRKKNEDNEDEILQLENEINLLEKKIIDNELSLKEEFKLRSKIAFISYNWKWYTNLCAINNLWHKEWNIDWDWRLDKETIFKHKEWIFCIIDGLHWFMTKYIINWKRNEAKKLLQEFHKEFWDKLYVEFQPHFHRYIAMSSKIIYDYCKELWINILINNSPRVISKEDTLARKTMLCKKYWRKFWDIDTIEATLDSCIDSPYLESYYIMSYQELFDNSKKMFWSFMDGQEIEEFIDNNNKIADYCEEFQLRCNIRLPKYQYCEDWMNEDEYLRKVCYDALEDYANKKEFVRKDIESYKELLEEELEVITWLWFSWYFLVEMDFIKFWKKNNFVWPGRWSAAWSLVTLLCWITSNIDPIQEQLLFERFLSFWRAKWLEYHLMSIKNEDFQDNKEKIKKEYGYIQPFIANKDLIWWWYDPAWKFWNVKSFEEIFEKELKEWWINDFSSINLEESEKYIRNIVWKWRITSSWRNTKEFVEQEFKILHSSTPKDILMFYCMHKLWLKAYNKTNSYIANELWITDVFVEDPYEMQIFSTRDIPDIDTDFKTVEWEDVMYNYIRERFWKDNVERIWTYQKFQINSLLRHFLSCMSVPPFRIDQLMWDSELDELWSVYEDEFNILDSSKKEEIVWKYREIIKNNNEELFNELEQKKWSYYSLIVLMSKNYSVWKHAWWILISDISLDEYLPLMWKSKDSLGTWYIESFTSKDTSYAWWIKFDVLKLKNLNIVESVCKKAWIDKLDLYEIWPDEYRSKESEEMYAEIIWKWKYSWLFQIWDNDSARSVADEMLKKVYESWKSITFNELSLMSAANRPAAIKAQLKDPYWNDIEWAHILFNRIRTWQFKENYFWSKTFEEVTKNSVWLVLYEEQTMIIAQKLCWYTELESSNLRKDFKKLRSLEAYPDKYKAYYDKIYNKFLNWAKEDKYEVFKDWKRYVWSNKRLDFIEQKKWIKLDNRQFYEKWISDEDWRKLTDLVFWFSAYWFNKAHADSYALITHWTCYLKYKYPVSFMSVLLDYNWINNNMIKDLEQQWIELLKPDINISKWDMTPDEENKKIYWWLFSIKWAWTWAEELAKWKSIYWKIKSLTELQIFTEKKKFWKRVIEPLIKVWAFDSIYKNRKKLLYFYENWLLEWWLHLISANYPDYSEEFENVSNRKYAKTIQRLLNKYDFELNDVLEDFLYDELRLWKKLWIEYEKEKLKDSIIELLIEIDSKNKEINGSKEDLLSPEVKRVVKLLTLKKDTLEIEQRHYKRKLEEQRIFEKEFLWWKKIEDFYLPYIPEEFNEEWDLERNEVEELFKKIRLKSKEEILNEEWNTLTSDQIDLLKEKQKEFYEKIDNLRKLEKIVLDKLEIEDFSNKELREMENEITEWFSFTKKELTNEQENLCKFILRNREDNYAWWEIVKIKEHIDKRWWLMAWIDFEVDCSEWKELFNRVVCFASNYWIIKDRIELWEYICFQYNPDFWWISLWRKIIDSSNEMFSWEDNQEQDKEELDIMIWELVLSKKDINEDMVQKKEKLEQKDKKKQFEHFFYKVNDVKKIREKWTNKKSLIVEMYISKDWEQFWDKIETYISSDIINLFWKMMKVWKKWVIQWNSKFSIKTRKTYFIPEDIFNFID